MRSGARLASALSFLGAVAAGSSALAQGAPPPAAPPPDPWFSEQPPAGQGAARPPDNQGGGAPPVDGGAYVQVPTPPPPPPPLPPDVPPYDEEFLSDDAALFMGMVAVRPFGTYVGEGPDPDDPTGLVAGHVGFRVHATGIADEDMVIRTDLEGFLGASSEGVEGEGRAFLALGLAKRLGGRNHIMFRFGAGGQILGNPVIAYQVADLPALELGYLHTGADGVIEIAPRVAMGVLHFTAFDHGVLEPDPAPAVGGRLLAGGDSLWSALEYELVTGDKPVHVGALTACFAEKFSICLDGRLASASLSYGGGDFDRVTALSAGLSLGLGVAEVED